MERKLGIYIHIPFCVRKCDYCDFLSFPAGKGERERYLEALLGEIEALAPKYGNYVVDTVFLGGGTPTALSGGQLERVLKTLKTGFSFADKAEVSLEANPGTVDPEKLEQCLRAGANRLSIGAQSLRDEELALLGRVHSVKDFFQAYRWARAAGFRNINVDLMAALPGQKTEEYLETLRGVIDLGPEHISAYSLIVEEGTPFYGWYGENGNGENGSGRKGNRKNGRPELPSEEEEREMDAQAGKILEANGYHRYEISNYARPGYECRHNMAYWKRYDYVGFGLGAASMVENVRWKNSPDMEEYIRGMKTAPEGVRKEVCPLGIQEQMEEFMFLGLRLTEGVGKKEFREAFGMEMASVYGAAIDKLCGQGLLLDGERVRLTPYGRDVSNYAMAEFLF